RCGFNNTKARNVCDRIPNKKYYCALCEHRFCKEHRWNRSDCFHCPYCEVQLMADSAENLMEGDYHHWFANEEMTIELQFVRHVPETSLETLRGNRHPPDPTDVSE